MKPTHHLRISWKLLIALLAIFSAISACAGSFRDPLALAE